MLIYLMGICSHRNAKGSREAKICEFEISLSIDEQVLRLQVAMEDTMRVTVVKTFNELIREFLHARTERNRVQRLDEDVVWLLV